MNIDIFEHSLIKAYDNRGELYWVIIRKYILWVYVEVELHL